jgi:hypothetical protein
MGMSAVLEQALEQEDLTEVADIRWVATEVEFDNIGIGI